MDVYDEIPSSSDDTTISSVDPSYKNNVSTKQVSIKEPGNEQNNNRYKSKRVHVEWSPENELILVEWCDVAQCYKWMNSRSHIIYSGQHAWFTIPAIILSTLSGTASFAQESIPANYKVYAPAMIGSLNIFIGILTTIQQYLKISELNEAHRISSISWDKFSRNIRIELAKRPEERSDAGSFIKSCRGEFDRLMETSPDITERVVHEFNRKFSGREGTEKRRRFDQLRKPDICDTLVSANETRHKWYLELDNHNESIFSDDEDDTPELRAKNSIIATQQLRIDEARNEIKQREEFEQNTIKRQIESSKQIQQLAQDKDKLYNEKIKHIETYVNSFVEIYERRPLIEEIIDNLENQVERTIIDKFLQSYSSFDNV